MKKVYKLSQPSDVEGKRYELVGTFASRKLADDVAATGHGNGSMGPSDGLIIEFPLFETAEEFLSTVPDEKVDELTKKLGIEGDVRQKIVRIRALEKLTDEEKEVLGLAMSVRK